jgi:hypothetical protein
MVQRVSRFVKAEMSGFDFAGRVRSLLASDSGSRELTQAFVEQAIAEQCTHEREEVNRLLAQQIQITAEEAVSIIHRHSASPIERSALFSALFAFLQRDPLGFVFTDPMSDAPGTIAGLRSTIDKIMPFKPNPGDRSEAATFHLRYIGLLYESKVHLTPQATFPGLGNGPRKSVRVDLLTWVPSKKDSLAAVELDGFEWHSDKESFTRDRARDRALKIAGVDVLRFSGSEINGSPAEVGSQLIEYLVSKGRLGNQ